MAGSHKVCRKDRVSAICARRGPLVQTGASNRRKTGFKHARMSRPRFHLAFPVRDLAEARAFYGGAARLSGGALGRRLGRFRFPRPPDRRPSLRAPAGSDATNPVDGEDVPVRHFGVILDLARLAGSGRPPDGRGHDFLIAPTVRFKGQAGRAGDDVLPRPFRQRAGVQGLRRRRHGVREMSVTFADIEAAAGRIAGVAVRTPLLESPALNERTGARILIKPETLQRVGAFKFRGAYNRLIQLTPDERTRGVVAFFVGQSRPGRGAGRAASRHAGDHRHPGRRPGGEGRRDARLWRRDPLLRPRQRGPRGDRRRPRRRTGRRSSCRPSTIAHVIAGQGTVGLEIADQAQALGSFARPGHRPDRRRRT